jgi:RNA polymerase sigma factor (sigma-70 family)
MDKHGNPFRERTDRRTGDAEYIDRALNGDNEALEALVLRHQSWMYNISLNMCGDPDTAEDITQEILIKMITKLSTYDRNRASFRTWLYRIAANHFINMKESRNERLFRSFSSVSEEAEKIEFRPDTNRNESSGGPLIDEETKISCALCILLCLSRRERLVFVLGTFFDAPDRVGAEICEISRDNYRKILSRSRKKVYEFFNSKCGLLKEGNPCTCGRQTDLMIKAGIIDRNDLLANHESYGKIRDMAGRYIRDFEDAYNEFIALMKDRPFFKGPDMVRWLKDLLSRHAIRVG